MSMTVSLVFLAVLMAVFGGWLFSHSVGVRPWEAQAAGSGQRQGLGGGQLPAAATAPRVGLAVFLAVATSLFALTVSAYLMRQEMAHDWRPLAVPGLLWWNTACLVLGSVALQLAWQAARRDQLPRLWRGLLVGGGFTIAFILGQALAWWQLQSGGITLAANPANAFFFLLTALHAVHLLGGLFAWSRSLFRLQQGATPAAVRQSVELCALYWHFLLVVWGILFALLLMT
ncbi:cytochrome c oxidase subunit 3 [Franzmannia pantelleriensis]|uniref:Cytochrome c oxidase subunit 3 n=1 Tax=Franzmannia pantelleriensis TaxID=48727 RepID=A0A1G9V6K9_9GAMM|nr:cytochrome c oxidase subunit 3 [Halomonas pantelleriensis]SDM67706.1 cytochrome c oxidase subunit 3 [Halomonas pantelleriensis]